MVMEDFSLRIVKAEKNADDEESPGTSIFKGSKNFFPKILICFLLPFLIFIDSLWSAA